MRLNGKLVLDASMFAFLVLFITASMQYPPEARMVPLAIGVPCLFLALLQLGLTIRKEIRGEKEAPVVVESAETCEDTAPEMDNAEKNRRIVFANVFVLSLLAGLIIIGIIPAFLFGLFFLTRFHYKVSILRSLVITVCATFIPYALFANVFGVTAWKGLFYQYFLR